MLAQLKADFPDEVRVVYRHFPIITSHDKASLAAIAAEAAGRQGQFWEMHDLLYARQREWAQMNVPAFRTWLGDRAVELLLEPGQFAADLDSQALAAEVQQAFDEAVELGIPGTPFLLINGRIYNGPTDYSNLSVVVRLISLQARQYPACPTMIIDPTREYFATLQLEPGEVVIELFPELAPRAVNNFVFLALEGYYDGVIFHRVFPGFIAQTGDPSGTGFGGPGYAFTGEDAEILFDQPGLLAMDPEVNGGQFFITYAPLPSLDGSYTIFGRVVEGIEILEGLQSRDPSQAISLPPGEPILSVRVEER